MGFNTRGDASHSFIKAEKRTVGFRVHAPVHFLCRTYASVKNRQGRSCLRRSDLKLGWSQMAVGHELFKQRPPVTLLKAPVLSAGGPVRLPEALFIIQHQRGWPGLHNSSFHPVEKGKLILSPWLLDKWQMISFNVTPTLSTFHHCAMLSLSNIFSSQSVPSSLIQTYFDWSTYQIPLGCHDHIIRSGNIPPASQGKTRKEDLYGKPQSCFSICSLSQVIYCCVIISKHWWNKHVLFQYCTRLNKYTACVNWGQGMTWIYNFQYELVWFYEYYVF